MSYMNICIQILNVILDLTELNIFNMISSVLGINIRLIYITLTKISWSSLRLIIYWGLNADHRAQCSLLCWWLINYISFGHGCLWEMPRVQLCRQKGGLTVLAIHSSIGFWLEIIWGNNCNVGMIRKYRNTRYIYLLK